MSYGKKVVKGVFVLLITAVVALFFYWFIGGAICNNIKAAHIEGIYSDMTLPKETSLVETASFVGNTGGTGNHTEIWAGMLIYSKLSIQEVENYFNGYIIQTLPDNLTDADEAISNMLYPWDYYDYKQEFTSLGTMDSGTGYYIISQYYDAFTQEDLRGH